MTEPFDPSEFDAGPPSGDPHADYRTLLDAMRRAGAEGVAEQSGALARQIEQDARQRADWGRTVGSEVRDLQRAAAALQRASTGIWLDRLKEWLWAALIALAVIFAAALAYRHYDAATNITTPLGVVDFDCNAASELGKTLLELLAVII